MLLTFKRRFAPYVWEGSKTHTIRLPRKNPPKIGEPAHIYTDARQKTMAMLGRWKITRIEPILITRDSIDIGGQVLTPEERNLFCWRDGFRPPASSQDAPGDAYDVFMQYWAEESKAPDRAFPFHGEVLHWDFMVRHPGRTVRAARDNSATGQAAMPNQLHAACRMCDWSGPLHPNVWSAPNPAALWDGLNCCPWCRWPLVLKDNCFHAVAASPPRPRPEPA